MMRNKRDDVEMMMLDMPQACKLYYYHL